MASATKTQHHTSSHRNAVRRPLWMLLFAILILVLAVASRFLLDQPTTAKPAPAPIERSSDDALAQLQNRLRANPDDVDAYAQLGLGLLQQVRESGDISLYERAGTAFDAALEREPLQIDALMGQGVLALALHDFEGALAWAEQARALNPFRAGVLGIMVDAQVELGRYDEAVATLQAMVDLRPDLQSYSRVSYIRELHGDVDGAIEAMETAATSALPGTEDWRWTLTHLGHLHFNRGDLAAAANVYETVLAEQATYPYAVAGMARVVAARSDTTTAIEEYRALTQRLPLPEFVIALGELYEATGNEAAAREQYELVEVMQQLNAAAGMDVDLEMALFEANHGSNVEQIVANARIAHAKRPNIYAADALAWSLYRAGAYAEAWEFSQEALRLGTQDAMLHFHAGMIAAEMGAVEPARTHLQQALTINADFSPLYGPVAMDTLATLEDAAATQ